MPYLSTSRQCPNNLYPSSKKEKKKKTKTNPSHAESGQLHVAGDWEMLVDPDQRLILPSEIAATTLQLVMVLWSNSCLHHRAYSPVRECG